MRDVVNGTTLDLALAGAQNCGHSNSRDALEQQDVERIARKALKELGVSDSTLTVVQAGSQPGVWRIQIGDRSLNIRCGQGSTPQWVRTQIFDQYLSR